MWPHFPELLETPVPRYTSFPTAAEFSDSVGASDHARALEGAEGPVSLYLHIPFCEQICWYCGCNTGAANRKQRLASYLEALHAEIALVAAALPKGAQVSRIAFGGGSPNAIAPTDFVRLIDALTLNFELARPDISIELDPRTLFACWGTVLSAVGARYASLGVQTFSPELQQRIRRIQPTAMIERSVEILRSAGVASLNFDLMYGLPGQTIGDLEHALDEAARLGANRIALFGYAHVPHLVPRQRRIDASDLPDQHRRFAMAEFGHRFLLDKGYEPVGFDHFALPGDPLAQAALTGRLRRNFQGFTDDEAPVLIGLGASAISSFPDLIVQNEKNAGRYRMLLSQGHLPSAAGIRRTADDRYRGSVIEGLLCAGRAAIGGRLMLEALPRLRPFMERGLCAFDDGRIVLAPHALPYARSIAAQFDPYRQHSPRRFSSAI
ncbi:MAG TPA: oxygen-independent coproporphyrinogen III oxidase [Sphingomonadaceae bacterium]|nr:oxygen-independent coproporphyrinogen III oxidase [Sphingomonadaceae bacterium]